MSTVCAKEFTGGGVAGTKKRLPGFRQAQRLQEAGSGRQAGSVCGLVVHRDEPVKKLLHGRAFRR